MFIVFFVSDNFGLSHNEHVQNCWHQWSRPCWRLEYLFWWYLARDVPSKSTKRAKLIRLSERDLFKVKCKKTAVGYEMFDNNLLTQPIDYWPFLKCIHHSLLIFDRLSTVCVRFLISSSSLYFHHQQQSKHYHNHLIITEILWRRVLRSFSWCTVHVGRFPLIPNRVVAVVRLAWDAEIAGGIYGLHVNNRRYWSRNCLWGENRIFTISCQQAWAENISSLHSKDHILGANSPEQIT